MPIDKAHWLRTLRTLRLDAARQLSDAGEPLHQQVKGLDALDPVMKSIVLDSIQESEVEDARSRFLLIQLAIAYLQQRADSTDAEDESGDDYNSEHEAGHGCGGENEDQSIGGEEEESDGYCGDDELESQHVQKDEDDEANDYNGSTFSETRSHGSRLPPGQRQQPQRSVPPLGQSNALRCVAAAPSRQTGAPPRAAAPTLRPPRATSFRHLHLQPITSSLPDSVAKWLETLQVDNPLAVARHQVDQSRTTAPRRNDG